MEQAAPNFRFALPPQLKAASRLFMSTRESIETEAQQL
jgi:hypothetical protein